MSKQTKILQLQGKANWCKLDIPDTKFDPNGKWMLDFYPDTPSLDILMDLKKDGLRNHIKMDEDGSWIRISRPTQKLFGGRLKAYSPPEIVDKENRPLPRTTRIGNGSDVTVNCEVYYFTTPQKTQGCAIRLLGIRIDNLVEYKREDYTKEELRAVKGFDKSPKPNF